MRIAIPAEVKLLEGRVSLIPAACAELIQEGHEVFLQAGAGTASGYDDREYRDQGVQVLATAGEVFEAGELLVKVKEPVPSEFPLLERRHTLFCYLHLAANPGLAAALQEIGLTAIAFETVEQDGALPLLAPMSDIAGRLAVQIGAHLLHRPQGGRGILLGGMPAAERGNVVVLGTGVAGGNAVRLAAALGANVTVFGVHREGLERMQAVGPNVTALPSYEALRAEAICEADLLIGAVLLPGARTPRLVSAGLVAQMRPGSVIIDISVDQGGCVETIKPTTYEDPTYLYEGVVHFGVTNMPGAVPRTASQVLASQITPFVSTLAAAIEDGGGVDALCTHPGLKGGVNVAGGKILHPAVLKALADG